MSTLSYHHNTPAPKKSNKVWIIVVIVLVVLCCLCAVVVVGGFGGYQFLRSSGTGIGDMFESNPSGQTSTGGDSDDQMQASTDIPAPSIQLPNLFGVELGDEMRCEPCGFSYKKVPGYTFNNDWEVLITMTAPGADEKIGPLILLAGGVPDEGFTQDGLIKAMKDTPLTYSNQKNIKVDGVSAVSLDASGTLEGVEIKVLVRWLPPNKCSRSQRSHRQINGRNCVPILKPFWILFPSLSLYPHRQKPWNPNTQCAQHKVKTPAVVRLILLKTKAK
jgi:nitrate reductase NapE component